MSSAVVAAGAPALGAEGIRAGVWGVFRVELRKLSAQILARLALAVCVLGPFVFIAIIQTQATLPADTLFGRWLQTSGFALPFMMLGLAAEGGFIVLTCVVAGDMFASEDRYGTWQTVLTRGARRDAVFVGKVLAACTYSIVVLVLLTVSSLIAGVLIVGSHPLVSLSGAALPAGRALALVLASWATALLPVLAFTALGLLFSIATRSGIMGVLGPLAVGLLMELFGVLGFRTLVLTTPFDAWHGLLVAPSTSTPLFQGAGVSIVYLVGSLGLAWLLFRRRDFAGPAPEGHRQGRAMRVRVAAVAVAAVVLIGVASYRPSPFTSSRLEGAVTSEFARLVGVKGDVIGREVILRGRPVTPEVLSNIHTSCRRGGQLAPSRGPGDDWLCVMTSGSGPHPLVLAYEVNAKPNGCFTAQGSAAIFGAPKIQDARYDTVVNPLYEFDGCLGTP